MKELFKKIGLKTLKDLQLFKANEMLDGETLMECLIRYSRVLGTDFSLEVM
jgi:hypothetical protein